MTHILHRELTRTLPVAVAGDGCYIVDSDGRRYFDGSGGAAVSCLGHSHPRVKDAIRTQLDKLAFAHTSFFTTEVAETLAETLTASAPAGIGRVCFVAGGSEANEAALKFARQFFLETGQPERQFVIARRQSYHGATLGALSITGDAQRRALYRPLLFPVSHVSPCYPYRDQREDETPEDYGARLAHELETTIQELGPDKVAVFVAETVAGATLGAVLPVPGYFRQIRDLCTRHGILLMLDEVMCGMGRTGSLHACAQEGIAPDLMTIAKGLGAGYEPIGGVLVAKHIADAIATGSGALMHGHTYLGHPLACAAALAVQQTIRDERLLDNVRAQGAALRAALVERFGDHPNVGDIRGRGLFFGLELVRDRRTKEPFDPSLALHARVKAAAMANGLMCYPTGGVIDGTRGIQILLAPPFIMTAEHVPEITDKLAKALAILP
ncbi:MAG: aspartate aminotransferase family protein [Vicinamibacterales bacterium]